MVQYFFRDNFCVCKFNGCDENEGVTIIPMRGLAQKMIEGLWQLHYSLRPSTTVIASLI